MSAVELHHGGMVRRLLNVYNATTEPQRIAGREWYPNAWAAARALVAGTELTTSEGAGIIAALSTRTGWADNLNRAAALVDTVCYNGAPAVGIGMRVPVRKAELIARREARPDAVLGGLKTRSFWRNICWNRTAVTVDVWAQRAATGRDDFKLTDNRYHAIAKAYRRAGELSGESPRDFQAIVWGAVRGRYE